MLLCFLCIGVRYKRYISMRAAIQSKLMWSKISFIQPLLQANQAIITELQSITYSDITYNHTYSDREFVEVHAAKNNEMKFVIDKIANALEVRMPTHCARMYNSYANIVVVVVVTGNNAYSC